MWPSWVDHHAPPVTGLKDPHVTNLSHNESPVWSWYGGTPLTLVMKVRRSELGRGHQTCLWPWKEADWGKGAKERGRTERERKRRFGVPMTLFSQVFLQICEPSRIPWSNHSYSFGSSGWVCVASWLTQALTASVSTLPSGLHRVGRHLTYMGKSKDNCLFFFKQMNLKKHKR